MESFDDLSSNLSTFTLEQTQTSWGHDSVPTSRGPSSQASFQNTDNTSNQFYNVIKIDRNTTILNGKCSLVFLDLTSIPLLKSNQYLVFFPSLSLWKEQKIFFKTQFSLTNQFFSLPIFNLGRNLIQKQKGDPIGFYTIGTLPPQNPPDSFIDNLKNTLQKSNFSISQISPQTQSLLSSDFSEKTLQLSDKQLSINPKYSRDVPINTTLYSDATQLIVFQDLPIQLLNQIQSSQLDYQYEFLYWIPFKIITDLQNDNHISILNLQKFSSLDIYGSNIEDQDIKHNLAKVILIKNQQFINLSINF